MKIDINNPYTSLSHNTIVNQDPTAAYSDAGAANNPVSAARTDSVTISSAARLVAVASRPPDTEPGFDEQRVAEPGIAIHSNNYAVNPERVAEKLLQFSMRLQ
jgi:flagellar biosynthesis anti-sigma factor FlgM